MSRNDEEIEQNDTPVEIVIVGGNSHDHFYKQVGKGPDNTLNIRKIEITVGRVIKPLGTY